MTVYRTFLFAPGNVRRKVEKSFTCGADAVVLDLEDAVALSEKARARKIVGEIVSEKRETPTYVRVNAISTGFVLDDLGDVVTAHVDGIVLPKVENPSDIEFMAQCLLQIEKRKGLKNNIEIVPFIETVVGLVNLRAVLAASRRIKRLFFGAVDFITDIGAERTPTGHELLYARSRLVIESRVACLEPPVDAVYTDIGNVEGLNREASMARQMGFQGKLVIHPSQVKSVNDVFSPSPEEVAWAEKVVEVFEESEAKGNAALKVDGKFVEYPVYKKAKRVLGVHRAVVGKTP
ncbi:MAG TPA: CoA ester lyase [Clostridia bacterium]|nr:CoA ester lyase [Clostridia bacterium]